MAALWLWARTDWRIRWRALVGVALLLTLAGGITLGVAGGARRAGTAVDRWKSAMHWQNVEVELNSPDGGEVADQFPTPEQLADEIAAVPGVRGVNVQSWIGVTPDPEGYFFNGAQGAERGVAPTHPVVAGRPPDPGDPREVMVNEVALEAWSVELGGTMTLRTLGADQWEQFVGLAPHDPRGPTMDVRVVGLIRDLESITDRPEPFLVASRAFLDRWAGQVISVTGLATVNADPTMVDDVVAALRGVGGGLYEAGAVPEDYASRVTDTIDVEVTALWAFTAASAIAALLIVGQALLRHATRAAAEQRALAAMGFGPRTQALASILAVAPALLGGLVGAMSVAVALSRVFPRGLARLAELEPGVRVDRDLLLIGGAGLAAAMLLLALATGWLAARTGRRTDRAGMPSRTERALSALPTVAGLGARLTLTRNRGSAAPAWGGAAAVAIGVGGILAVTTVDRSVDQLLSAPALYGAPWDLEAGLAPGDEGDLGGLAADPEVEMVAAMRVPVAEDGVMAATGPAGSARVEPFTFDVVRGPVPIVLDEGRPPGPGEVAAGAEVLERVGASVGDAILVAGFDGEVPLTVTGRSVNAGNDELDQGFYVTPETFEELLAECGPGDSDLRCRSATEGVGVRLRDGADAEAALSRLQAIQPRLGTTARPSVVDSLTEIGSTPQWLGVFLGALGLAGLAHAVISGGRRARHDLAVARALGLRPGQAASAVRWGATVTTVAGIAAGVLIGLVSGRLVWRRVVAGVGALLDVEVSLPALVLVPLATLVITLLVATIPGRHAARLQPAKVLRVE